MPSHPTPEQVNTVIVNAQKGTRAHGWDRLPVLLALYLDPDDPAGPLRWSVVPVPPARWRTEDPDDVMRDMAKSLATPEAVYCLSAEEGWYRWCGLLFAIEVWEVPWNGTTDRFTTAEREGFDPANHPQRVQSRVVATIHYPGDTDDTPLLTATSWPEDQEMRWVYGPDQHRVDMGDLADSLYLLGSSMRDLRRAVITTGITPTKPIHEHHQDELANPTGTH